MEAKMVTTAFELPGHFLKVEMTIGGLLAIVVVLWFAVREHKEDKATRSGDRLD